MAVTQAMCTSFKVELFQATHNFNLSGGSTFKIALYTQAAATLSAATTAYTATGEVSGTGYTAGGGTLTRIDPTSSGTTAFCDFADQAWTTSTITADAALIYNSTASNASVSAHTFTSASSVAGTFTIQFPTADASNAVLRLA